MVLPLMQADVRDLRQAADDLSSDAQSIFGTVQDDAAVKQLHREIVKKRGNADDDITQTACAFHLMPGCAREEYEGEVEYSYKHHSAHCQAHPARKKFVGRTHCQAVSVYS